MYEFLRFQAQDVMSRDVVVIGPETTIREAQLIFNQHDFNGLPVLTRSNRLTGFLTKLDVLKAFAFDEQAIVPQYSAIMNWKAAQVMTVDPVTVEPDLPLTRVMMKMIETRFKSFPVMDQGRLVGMVAREDVLKALDLAARGLTPDRISENSIWP